MRTRVFEKGLGLALIMILCLGFNCLYSTLYHNATEIIFVTPLKVQSTSDSSTVSMTSLIQAGGGYFLKAKSDFSLLLRNVEISDPSPINNTEIQALLKSVRNNLLNAISNFRSLKSLADVTAYDPYVVEKLKRFDYDTLKAKRFHNSSTWLEVKGYLLAGDVRGMYAKTLSTLEELNKMVDGVYVNTSSTVNIFPDIEVLYGMHSLFCETATFGQYSAEVFYEVSK